METTKILIVDDEPDILEFLSYNIRKEGFKVFVASNGQEALRIVQQINPSLILLISLCAKRSLLMNWHPFHFPLRRIPQVLISPLKRLALNLQPLK